MVEWSVAALRATDGVDSIVVACPPGRLHELGGAGLALVEGGATRSQSVANALEAVDTELVAIHDAARPLLTPQLVEGVVASLVADPEADGAIAAIPVVDTIKRVVDATGEDGTRPPFLSPGMHKGGWVVDSTLDRDRLWAAQTPQVFRVEALRAALADASESLAATDEAMLVEGAGGKVLIHPSSPENLKVTTALDLRLAELLLAER